MFKETSERRAEEEKMKQEKRLPPGQSLTKKFPVLHYGPVPKFQSRHLGFPYLGCGGEGSPVYPGRSSAHCRPPKSRWTSTA